MSLFLKVKNKIIAFSNYLGNSCFVNRYKYTCNTSDKKIFIFSVVWGEFVDVYFNYVIPSLFQSGNLPLLKSDGFEIQFLLYTIDDPEMFEAKYKAQFEKYKLSNLEVKKITTNEKEPRKINISALLDGLRTSIDHKAIFIMAPPDILISNYSLYNSVMSVYYKGLSFASAHPRVKFDILKDEKIKCMVNENAPIDSAAMVSLAMSHLHDKYIYANDMLDKNTTYAGVSIRKLSDNIYNVIHNLPSPFVVCPQEEDFTYFSRSGDFNQWDRGWLEMLVRRNRIKISGSSDQYFSIELTKDEENAKPKPGLLGNDVAGESFHNRVCNMVNVTWRGDGRT